MNAGERKAFITVEIEQSEVTRDPPLLKEAGKRRNRSVMRPYSLDKTVWLLQAQADAERLKEENVSTEKNSW